MKFKIRTRHANARFTVKYIQKYAKPGSMRSTIPKFDGTTDWDYAKLVDKKFEQGRAKGQQRLYLHQIVAFHPSDAHKSDQELLDIAEESLVSASKSTHLPLIELGHFFHNRLQCCIPWKQLFQLLQSVSLSNVRQHMFNVCRGFQVVGLGRFDQ